MQQMKSNSTLLSLQEQYQLRNLNIYSYVYIYSTLGTLHHYSYIVSHALSVSII